MGLALLVVPIMDVSYVKGRRGLYYVKRYMQALCAGRAGSGSIFVLIAGVLVSVLRIFAKAMYPQDVHDLRNSALLYFFVGILLMIICLVFYNVAHRLPVIKYYNELKIQAVNEEKEEIMGRVKWHGTGIVLIYVVNLSTFPGFIPEDVHSTVLGDWYAILLITSHNVFHLVSKCLTAVYLVENANAAVGACFARLLFYPLYLGCLHVPNCSELRFL